MAPRLSRVLNWKGRENCQQPMRLVSKSQYSIKYYAIVNKEKKDHMIRRGPNLFFKYFYFLFGPGLLYPLRVLAKVQIFFWQFCRTIDPFAPKNEIAAM